VSRHRRPGAAGPNGRELYSQHDAIDEPRADSEAAVADGFDASRYPDNFYPGLIVFLDRARGRGTIRSHSGREVSFEFPFVSVVGAPIGGRAPGMNLLSEGDEVGFDVGWTSKGLRVTRIRPADTSRHDS
jgi:hypothetical protein